MRVAGVITAKGANIVSLTVAPDPWQEGVSRMTMTADLEPHLHVRVVKEMNRLVNVMLALDVTDQPRGTRPSARFPAPLPDLAVMAERVEC
jgi:acetolactate synthase small subunit